MFGFEVDFLAGRYTAASPEDHATVEWPPHPARLYSALVATWAHEEPPDEWERAALEWLAALGAPRITFGPAHPRRVVTHFVPVNDANAVSSVAGYQRTFTALRAAAASLAAAEASVLEGGDARATAKARQALDKATAKAQADSTRLAAGGRVPADVLKLLPSERGKQARTFPTSIPEHPIVRFTWDEATEPTEHGAVLDSLAARVHRLGHSSSLVAVRRATHETDTVAGMADLVPKDDGQIVLRVPAAGLLDALEADYSHHQGREPRSLPAALVAYGPPATLPRQSARPVLADDWVVLAVSSEGPSLPISRAVDVARALRGALLAHADDPPPEVLSGHAVGPPGERTSPSSRPHTAFVALPFVGHRHADGGIRGVAVVLPRSVDQADRTVIARAIGAWRSAGAELRMGRAGVLELTAVDELDPRAALRPATWCRPSRNWASVTPVVFDRTPKHLFKGTRAQRDESGELAREVIAQACAHIGLPRPDQVTILTSSAVPAAPRRHDFPPFVVGGRARLAVHVGLTFDEPVHGPVLIGAGRYVGLGLCRPLDGRGGVVT